MRLKTILTFCICFLILTCKVCFAQQPKLMLPIGHTADVNSVQYSPDGKRIVTASWDGTAKIWDAASGKIIADLKGHTKSVQCARFSPDGKKIVTASKDNTAKIWDAITGSLVADLKIHTLTVNSAEFSPDGKKIVTASWDRTATIWDVASGQIIADLSGHTDGVYSAHFSGDGKKIVTASQDNTAKIWDVATFKLIANIKGHTDNVSSAEFSPDSKKIVTASSDKSVKIWDAVTGDIILDLVGHNWRVSSAYFSPDGKKIISSSDDHTVTIWDAIAGKLIGGITHKGTVGTAEFSPDGMRAVSFCDKDNNTAKIWDVVTGKLITTLKGHKNSLYAAHFSSDGKTVVTCSQDNTAKVWDPIAGNIIADLKGHINDVESAEFSPDGKQLVTSSGKSNTAAIWDVASGDLIANLKGHTGFVRAAKFSPNGKNIVTASDDNTAKVWDATSGDIIADFKGHKNGVFTASFSPSCADDTIGGIKIVTVSLDKTVKIWDAANGKLIIDIKEDRGNIHTAYFSPDGKKITTLSVHENKIPKIWNADNGKLIAELKGHTKAVGSIEFSPNSQQVVTSAADNTVKIWDANTGSRIIDLKGPVTEVYSAHFNSDSKQIVTISPANAAKIWDAISGNFLKDFKEQKGDIFSSRLSLKEKQISTITEDNIAKTWDAASGKLIAELKGHTSPIKVVEFSPDGKKIVTTSSDNTAKIWDAVTGKNLYSFFTVDSGDYLIVDAANHYNGTEAARKLLYFTCGTEIIELDQVKDQLWVPNLAERIMKGETINAKTLDELNICGLTPGVEDATDKAGVYLFKIKPQRGGLGETVLLVNGIEARRYKQTELKKNGEFFDLVVNKAELKNLFIPGKENPVTVKAYTADNAISSRGLKVIEDKTKEVTTPPNLYAVMVGVSDYKGEELDLKYAAKDANDISTAVGNAAKKLLNTDGKEHVFMYNLTTANERYQLPEKNSIKKLLEEIGKKATANDILMIFFAGHGVMAGEAEKKQFYFLTADASGFTTTGAVKDVGISTSELVEWMKPQNIKAQKRILIFDACNSGQAINDIAGKDLAVRNDDKAQQTKAIDKLNEKSGLFILSASASNQAAYEMGRYSQGLLTYSLLKAIKQQPDILEDGKYLDVSRWFNAAEKTVTELSKENGARQEPQIVSNTNFNIGIVDNEVMAKIILPQEKPLFAASNFQNSDEAADGDNLDMSRLINLQLNDIASRGSESSIVYMVASNSPDALTLSGRYDVKGNDVIVRISVKKNNDTKYRFEEKGAKDNLKELIAAIVKRAADWAATNK